MKNRFIHSALFIFFFARMIFAINDSLLEAKLPGLQSSLPKNWIAWISTDPDSATKVPQGCFHPLFNVYFLNAIDTFHSSPGYPNNPKLLLCFYDIKDSDTLKKAIEQFSYSSSMPPIEYCSTNKYMVITTPLFINGGCFNDAAQSYYRPLDTAIRAYLTGTAVSKVIPPKKIESIQNTNNRGNHCIYTLLGRKIGLKNTGNSTSYIFVKKSANTTRAELFINENTVKKP